MMPTVVGKPGGHPAVGKRADHARRYQARFRPHAGFILAHAAFAAIFVALVLSAFHAPSPHVIPVGIVAPATVTGQVEDALDGSVHGGFDLRVYSSEARARTGIAHREVDGALIASGRQLRLLVAQADGTGPAQALTKAFDAIAAKSGRPLTVTDVAPPLADDSEALSPFFIILGVLIPSLAAGSASALVFRRARPAWSVAAPAVVAVAIGLVAAGIADGVSGLGHYAVIAAIVALFSLAVAAPMAALGRLWPPLVSLALLVFLVFGIPASGGPANLASFGPAFLRPLHPALPLGAAADAVRGAVYFDGFGTAGPLWVLAVWTVAGIIALALAVALRRPAPARPVSLTRTGVPVLAETVGNGQFRAGLHAAPVPARTVPAGSVPARTEPARLAGEAAFSPAPEPGGAGGAASPGPDPARTVPGEAAPAPPVSLVVGFDSSAPARRALDWAARLAAARPAVLRIVYADHVVVGSDLSSFAYAEMAAARDQEADKVAGAAAEIAAAAGVAYTFERRAGAPADAILSGASAQAETVDGAPVIVVGRSGHAARHVLGSVPVRLLHNSPYPVLAIP
jgi:nucleotide-binding universal stress UspA family protein